MPMTARHNKRNAMNYTVNIGVFNARGELCAVTNSESEGHFMTLNRGHLNGGFYLQLPSYGELCAALITAREAMANECHGRQHLTALREVDAILGRLEAARIAARARAGSDASGKGVIES